MASKIIPGKGRRVSEFNEIDQLAVHAHEDEHTENVLHSGSQKKKYKKGSQPTQESKGWEVTDQEIEWVRLNFQSRNGRPLEYATIKVSLEAIHRDHAELDDLDELARRAQIEQVLAGEYSFVPHPAKDMTDHRDEESITDHHGYRYRYSQATQDLVGFMAYLAFFLLFLYVGRTSDPYWMKRGVETYLTEYKYNGAKSFTSVHSTQDLFDWMYSTFLPVMYPLEASSGTSLTCEQRQYMLDGVNYRVGAVRIRQVRVEQDSCEIPSMFEDAMDRCFAPWAWDYEEQGTFQGIKYQTSEQLRTPAYYSSPTRHRFPGGGFVVLLPNSYDLAVDTIEELYDDTFIDYQTRAIFIEWLTYNVPTGLLTSNRLIVEYGAEGDILPSSRIYSSSIYDWHLALTEGMVGWLSTPEVIIPGLIALVAGAAVCYVSLRLAMRHALIGGLLCGLALMAVIDGERSQWSASTYLRMILEPCMYVFVVSQLVGHLQRCVRLRKLKRSILRYYSHSAYTVVEVINLLVFLSVIVVRLGAICVFYASFLHRFESQLKLPCSDSSAGEDPCDGESDCTFPFVSFFELGAWDWLPDALLAFNTILIFFQLFRYTRMFTPLVLISETLRESGKRMLTIVLIVAIVMCGFAMAFHVAFGFRDAKYRDFFETCKSLFEVILGEFDLAGLRADNPILAPVFFVFFIVIVVMVILSMFVAIVTSAYEDISNSLGRRDADFFVHGLSQYVIDGRGVKMSRAELFAATNMSAQFQEDPSLVSMTEEDIAKARSILDSLETEALAMAEPETETRLPFASLTVQMDKQFAEALLLSTGHDERAVLRDLIHFWGQCVRRMPLLARLATEEGLEERYLSHRDTPSGSRSSDPTQSGEQQDGVVEEKVETEEERELRLMMNLSDQFTLPGLSADQRLFLKRLRGPRLAVLKHLSALEDNQKNLLDAIEALGKRSRTVAHRFVEMESKLKVTVKKARADGIQRKALESSLLPSGSENYF